MASAQENIIPENASIRDALARLNERPQSLTLFVNDEQGKVVGTVTDGDIRRGLLGNVELTDPVSDVMNRKYQFLRQGELANVAHYHDLRDRGLKLVPVLNEANELVQVVSPVQQRAVLPVDAVIMAGGEGRRLRPLTLEKPKPLLPVGGVPIIERNITRLSQYGVHNIWLTINYLGAQLVDYFGDGSTRDLNIWYVDEAGLPLGTMGSMAMVRDSQPGLQHDFVLMMNSDLLTNIDFEDLFLDFIEQEADLAVASIPYEVKVPYAILERNDRQIRSFREKPTYTYYANAGIYLMRRELLQHVPVGAPYNATDFMEALIAAGKRVIHYPILGYWLDIGKPEDYERAQRDVEHLQL